MLISKEQVRAARAFLNWDRQKLSQESGISVSQISNLETGETKDPRTGTLEAILTAFTRHGIVFKDGGIFQQKDFITVIEGEGWYLKLLDDVYFTLMDQPDTEFLLLCADDRASPPEVNNRIRKIRNAGIRMRQLVEQDNAYLMGPLKEYRYIPHKNFRNYVSIIYGDKVAVCTEGNTKAIVFKDPLLADTWKNIFEIMWDSLDQPEKSNASERF